MRRVSTAFVVLAVLAALAWGGWQAISGVQFGSPEEETPIQVTASAQFRTLEETVVTRGVTGFGLREPVTAAGSGRITAVEVTPGSTVESGNIVFEVDGRPIVAVHGSTPFWRNLAQGDRGPDVEMLQHLLVETGYLSLEPDGRYGGLTRLALRAWQVDHGFPEPDGVFLINDLLVGEWPQRVGQVPVRVGEFIQPDTVLFEITDETPSVTVELIPSDRLRVSEGDPAEVEISATEETAAGSVAGVAVTPVVDEAGSIHYPGTITLVDTLQVPEGTQVRVVIVIDRVEDVVAVPLASLIADGEGGSAVRALDADGSTETVPVELGISQGAWVEVRSGLSGGETVLVAEG